LTKGLNPPEKPNPIARFYEGKIKSETERRHGTGKKP